LRAEDGFHGGTWAFQDGLIGWLFLPDLMRPYNPDSLAKGARRLILAIASAAKQSSVRPAEIVWIASLRSQ
jgi:hypothetical protein